MDNVVDGVNFGPGSMPGDIMIDNSVPVMSGGGVPTTQCVPFYGPPAVQGFVNISGNVITQAYGTQAVTVWSTATLVLSGNSVTRGAGAPVPPLDMAGEGVVSAALSGNVCDGRACRTSGL